MLPSALVWLVLVPTGVPSVAASVFSKCSRASSRRLSSTVRPDHGAGRAASTACNAVLKAAAWAEKSSVPAFSCAFTSDVRRMPLDGSPSSSRLCSASRRLTTASVCRPSAEAVAPASVSGVTTAPHGAEPSSSAPARKRTVSPGRQSKRPCASVCATAALPAR